MTDRIHGPLLVLHTGGTIGMRRGPRGYAPRAGALRETLRGLPQLHEPAPDAFTEFTTRQFANGARVGYDLFEYDPLLDSANLELSHWVRFAEDIGRHYERYVGFVLLHGTDTMAFTASALSFLLEGLGKPVILTGSQIPLCELGSDGLANVLGALALAALHPMPEVGLFFHGKLLRGNRASKHDASSFDAFDAPNFPPLAHVGTEVSLRVPTSRSTGPLRVHSRLSPHVASLRIYPGITADVLANFVRAPLEGLVLETYGAGNGPERPDILRVLREATERGLLILNVTQCPRGEVRPDYQVGRALAEAGVIPGGDLTAEAALAKLAFVLGQRDGGGLPDGALRELLSQPLRGEMTASNVD